MSPSERILKEEDPYLREVWAAGYDDVIVDRFDPTTATLVNYNLKKEKKINFRDFYNSGTYKIITGVLPGGKLHRWISEADGSAQRFRDLIAMP